MARILYVTTSTTIGGSEKTLYHLATGLSPERYDVVGVACLKPLGYYARALSNRGIPVYQTGHSLSALAELINEKAPDILHCFLYRAMQMGRLAKRFYGVPGRLVLSPRVHYRSRPKPLQWLDRLLRSKEDFLAAESNANRDFAVEGLGYAPAQVGVIRNGVDLSLWQEDSRHPFSARERQRKSLGFSGSETVVGAVGRLDVQKGFEFLIEAMSRLREPFPELRCVIVGDGPEKTRLQRKVESMGMQGLVYFVGEQADMRDWYGFFDLFALPSLWEGLPNALLETMACGIPAVASSVDGVLEVVKDGENGLLVPPGDPEALAEALAELLKDSSLRSTLAEKGKKDVSERFTLDRMVQEYDNLYQKILR